MGSLNHVMGSVPYVTWWITNSRDRVTKSRDGITTSRDGISTSRDGVIKSRDVISTSRDGISTLRDGVTQSRDKIITSYDVTWGDHYVTWWNYYITWHDWQMTSLHLAARLIVSDAILSRPSGIVATRQNIGVTQKIISFPNFPKAQGKPTRSLDALEPRVYTGTEYSNVRWWPRTSSSGPHTQRRLVPIRYASMRLIHLLMRHVNYELRNIVRTQSTGPFINSPHRIQHSKFLHSKKPCTHSNRRKDQL